MFCHSSVEVQKSEGIAECLVTDIWSRPDIHFIELVPLKNQSKGWIYAHKKQL